MNSFVRRASLILGSPQVIPSAHRKNFFHLYLDVAWFGVLNGSVLSFLLIYATRLGANGQQVGLINAAPAVVTLLFALPAATWLNQRSIRGGVFWSALIFRLFYLLLIPLPALLLPNSQIWAIILITLVMSVPGTALSVGFNALFAEAVPIEWRGHVAGIRNAITAFTTTLTTLACGYLLTHMPFPASYQVVFALGFVGAMFSTIHVGAVRPAPVAAYPDFLDPGEPDDTGLCETPPKRSNIFDSLRARLRLDVLTGPFMRIILLLFFFHLAQYLAVPIFPVFQVNNLHLSDQVISFGSSIFNVLTFLGSLRLEWIVRKLGNKRVMGFGVVMLSLYPGFFALAKGVGLYMVASVFGGAAWALVGGVLYNYLLERVPAYDRPAYLAWYTLAFNAAVLVGSLVGPALASQIGLVAAMAIYALCRLLAGVAILKWG